MNLNCLPCSVVVTVPMHKELERKMLIAKVRGNAQNWFEVGGGVSACLRKGVGGDISRYNKLAKETELPHKV